MTQSIEKEVLVEARPQQTQNNTKVVGNISIDSNGKKTYNTNRDETTIFRKYNGIGISEEVLKQIKEAGCEDIVVRYKDTDEEMKTKVSTFLEFGIEYDNEGDKQKVLPLQYFEKDFAKRLFNRIKYTMKEYVSVTEEEYDLFILWIMHTYLVDDFGVTPYIHIKGLPASGKSTVMRFCSLLARNGKKGSFSKASIYRLITKEKATLFFNEFENVGQNNELIEVLNNGYEEGQLIAKCGKDDYDEVGGYSPFCPKMFGTVYKESIPTLDSRSISVRTFKSSKPLKSMVGMDYEEKQLFEKLKKVIEKYILSHKEGIMKLYKNIRIPLANRAGQIIKPLATIEKYFGFDSDIVSLYKKQIYENVVKDIHTDRGLQTLLVLYKHNGKASVKQVTKEANENLSLEKSERYYGGILRNLDIGEYITRQGNGYQIDVNEKKMLDIFESRNVDKELLDKLAKKQKETMTEITKEEPTKEQAKEEVSFTEIIKELNI